METNAFRVLHLSRSFGPTLNVSCPSKPVGKYNKMYYTRDMTEIRDHICHLVDVTIFSTVQYIVKRKLDLGLCSPLHSKRVQLRHAAVVCGCLMLVRTTHF